jgi:hypothetical protein
MRKATAGFASAASVAGVFLLGMASASAATPPWENTTSSPNAVGTISFYDTTGAQITGGAISDSPLAKYFVGSVAPQANGTQAVITACLPQAGVLPDNWSCDYLTSPHNYPVTSGPSSITSLTSAHPVATGNTGDNALNVIAAEFPNTSTDPNYQGIYQIRLFTSNPTLSSTYDTADVKISGSTWSQVYPTVLTNTATTVSSSANPSTVGSSVTFTATETPAAAGSVQFSIDGTATGSPVAVNGSGVAQYATSSLAVGTHTVSAAFTPTDTTTFAGSTGSLSGGQVVNPVATATTTALAVGGNNTTAGQDATLTATVTVAGGGTAAGTVSFYDNGSTTPINATPVAVTSGQAVFDVAAGFTQGTHSIVAKFSPTNVAQQAASQSAPAAFFTNPAQQTGSPCAQPGSSCTDVQNIQATVGIGTLTISTPYTSSSPLDLGTLTLNSGATLLSASAQFNNIIITDQRAGNLGWTATALATALNDGGTNANSSINAQNVGLTSMAGTGSITAAVPANNPAAAGVAPGDTGALGLGGTTPHTIASAPVGTNTGTETFNGALTLNAPTSTEPGLFKGTITFTVG